MKKKPVVWIVDDIEQNLRDFKEAHDPKNFRVKVFKDTDAVINELNKETPDALVCDIYFYPPKGDPRYDPGLDGEIIEKNVKRYAIILRKMGKSIEAEGHQKGITLAEYINGHYKNNPPFPIFVYTSKGPYILEGEGFRRIERAGMHWLFKTDNIEQQKRYINERIKEHKGAEDKVFVVHGRRTQLRKEVSEYLKDLGLKPIVLQDKAHAARTIFEQLKKYSDVKFAVILLTGDDWGRLKNHEGGRLKKLDQSKWESRARQNVVLELGYFLGYLGKDHVFILREKGVKIPSDVESITYDELNKNWKTSLRKELKDAKLVD